MTYGGFKDLLKTIMPGDNFSQDTFDTFGSTVLICMREVAEKCNPLELVSNNPSCEVLKTLEDGLFIRVPEEPKEDTDILDIDETLCVAVAYSVATILGSSHHFAKYIANLGKHSHNYIWNQYNDLQHNKYDLCEIAIRNSLNFKGFKKIYTHKHDTIKGNVYIWDDDFINKLNEYLKDETIYLSRSDRKNIDEYIDYQINGNEDNEMYEKLDEYLGELRNE